MNEKLNEIANGSFLRVNEEGKAYWGQSEGGGGGASGQFIVNIYDTNIEGTKFAADKTYDEISAAIESGMCVVIHKKRSINEANYDVFHNNQNEGGIYNFCRVSYGNQIKVWRIRIGVVDGEMAIAIQSKEIQVVTS